MMLRIKGLIVEIQGKRVLNGLDLEVERGTICALMGPNGAGKSSIAKVLAGHPAYEVVAGEVYFKGQNLLELEPEERSKLGLFMSFQYPVEIPGVSNFDFLYAIVKARRGSDLTREEFGHLVDKTMEQLEMRPEFKERNLNEGFSGGEKKRNEILQMALLNPSLAILDETDSGLDIDAMRVVAKGVKSLLSPDKSLLLITHYQRLLDYIEPHVVHVMLDGKIVKSGERDLALTLEERGYDWLC